MKRVNVSSSTCPPFKDVHGVYGFPEVEESETLAMKQSHSKELLKTPRLAKKKESKLPCVELLRKKRSLPE